MFPHHLSEGATAAIFLTCAVHHGAHVVHVLMPYAGVDIVQGKAMRDAWGPELDEDFELSNARTYGLAPFRVRITSHGSQVNIDVEVHGPGIPEEFSPRLFQEHSRAAGNTARGTGLGLFGVRALAEAQGGAVTYTPGQPSLWSLACARVTETGIRHTPDQSISSSSERARLVHYVESCA